MKTRRTVTGWMAGGVSVLSLLSTAACENGMKNMYAQDKYAPLAASNSWPDGRASRPLPPGAVPYSAGTWAGTSSGLRGETSLGERARAPYDLPSLERGRERYDIYCTPCHGASGDGNGLVVSRGFPRPPSYHSERLRAVPDTYLYQVIGHGYGVMYGYGDRIDEQDRWAIVGYVRALQLAQNAQLSDVPPAERARLRATPP